MGVAQVGGEGGENSLVFFTSLSVGLADLMYLLKMSKIWVFSIWNHLIRATTLDSCCNVQGIH